jgi:DNA topoisomerase IB
MTVNRNGNGASLMGDGILPPGLDGAFPEGFRYEFNEGEMKALDVMNASLLSRQELFRRQLDPRRNINEECGFPEIVSVENLKEMWDREAVAARVVQCFAQESWQIQPGVFEDEDPEKQTEFEEAWDQLGKSLTGQRKSWYKDEKGSSVWSLLARADELSGIGSFGVILLGFGDGQEDLSQPVKPGGGKKLMYASVFDESLVQITRWYNDKKNPSYGKPEAYSIRINDLTGSDHVGSAIGMMGLTTTSLNIHESRVIHLADGYHTASSNETFAIPRMMAVFNNLLGLRKLYAGSPEMYWKGAFPGFSWESHPSLGADVKINRAKFRDQMEQFMNGLQRYTANIGGSLKTLSPIVSDPTAQINVQIDAICIKLGIPRQVFIGAGSSGIGSGKETESLTDTWVGRLKGRQENYITPKVIVPFVDRLIWAGVLPEPEEFHVKWPDMTAPSATSRAQVALTTTQAITAYIGGGGENAMTLSDWYTRVLGMDDESVEEILDNVKEQMEAANPESPDEEYFPGVAPTDPEGEEGFDEEENPDEPPPDEGDTEEESEEEEENPGFGGKVENSEGEDVENCKGKGGKPGPCPDPTEADKAEPVKATGKSVTGTGEAKEKGKGAPGTGIMREATTKPPPGASFKPDVDAVDPKTGVTKTARVGVGGMDTPPEPPVPQLPNLTKHERAIETEFRDAFHKDPDGAAKKFLDVVKSTTKPGDPPTFGTDDAKVLHSAWGSPDMPLEQRSQNRATLNNVLHQTANAITKRAFMQHLDTLQKGDSILVTVGGCAAGKGYALKQVPEALEAKKKSKAVWDSAGDQNATENPWIQQEAEKRGLKVTYMHVDADPKTQWAHPDRGAVKRAQDPNDGRMVDAQVYADSHAIGAKNHHEFHQRNKDNKNAEFIFLKSGAKVEKVDGISKEALSLDRHELAQFAMDTVSAGDAPAHIKRGATSGVRLWGPPKASKASKAVANQEWIMNAKDEWPGWQEAEEEDVKNHNFMAQYASQKGYPLKSKNEKPVDLNDDGSEKGSDPQDVKNQLLLNELGQALGIENAGANCGISKGGFQPGNTCAKGGGPTYSLEKKGYDPKHAGHIVVVNGQDHLVKKSGETLLAVHQRKPKNLEDAHPDNREWLTSDGKPAPKHIQEMKGLAPQWICESKRDKDGEVVKDKDGKPVFTGNIINPPGMRDQVFVNPQNQHLTMQSRATSNGKIQPAYATGHKAARKEARFADLTDYTKDTPKGILTAKTVTKQVDKDKKSKEHGEEAHLMAVLRHTGIRVGGTETAAKDKGYGGVTLEGRHVVVKNGKTFLKFVPGKSHGEERTYEIKDAAIAKELRERAENAGSKGLLFNTNYKRMSQYSKERTGVDLHDHRRIASTDIAIEALQNHVKEYGKPKTEKAYRDMVYAVADHAAELIGNSRSQQLGAYISEHVWEKYRPKGVTWVPKEIAALRGA